MPQSVPENMLHAGLMAHSPDGAALAFLEFCHEGNRRYGGAIHPDITLDYIAMGRSLPAWDAGDVASVRATLATSIERLKAAGAAFFFCPDNTAHIALEAGGPTLALPGLNIAEVVAEEALQKSFTKVGILGTKYTMDGPVYDRALNSRGIETAVPDKTVRVEIDRIIFEELCNGQLTDQSRQYYVDTINSLKTNGCDAVALVCTEIPLLITPEVSPLPTLNSTKLLSLEAFRVGVGEAPLPSWSGGPF